MRHKKRSRRFSRTTAQRQALFRSLAIAIVKHEAIKTTLPKAKSIRGFLEPLITRAKEDSVANRRFIFSKLRDKEVVGKLFNELGPLYKSRPGGYLRLLKCGYRQGDSAPMAYIELVDKEQLSQGEQAKAS